MRILTGKKWWDIGIYLDLESREIGIYFLKWAIVWRYK